MISNLIRLLLIVLFATSSSFGQLPGKIQSLSKVYVGSNIDGYNIYVPSSCTEDSEPYPVIVFLQGGLGVGGPVRKLLQWALPMKIGKTNGIQSELDELRANSFVVVMPHIFEGQFYDHPETIEEILDEVIENHNVDPNRIYLTGLSRGGYGTWGVASRLPDRFAAIAPICGSAYGVKNFNALKDLPMWVAHNPADDVVGYNGSLKAVEKVEELRGEEFYRTTKIAGTNYHSKDLIFTSGSNPAKEHDAWTEMYDSVEFYKWLLQFSK